MAIQFNVLFLILCLWAGDSISYQRDGNGLTGWEHLSINKIMKSSNGNNKKLLIGSYNIAKGLVDSENNGTYKLTEIKNKIKEKNADILGIIETNLHGPKSRVIRSNPIKENEAVNELQIPGYDTIFPATWKLHDQARLIVFIRSSIPYKVHDLPQTQSDLPMITLIINNTEAIIFIYREYTGGISGLKDERSQVDRLSRMREHWNQMNLDYKDVTMMGDMNVDEHRLYEPGYQTKIVELLQDFKCSSGMRQLITQDTRRQIVNGILRTSLIDHLYSSRPELITSTSVSAITDSDHSCIWANKSSQAPKHYPKQIKRRCFKEFNVRGYLEDLQSLDLEKEIKDLSAEKAAEVINQKITELLDYYAPIRLIQNRNNYSPALSKETKDEINKRNEMRKEVYIDKNIGKLEEYKNQVKMVRQRINYDKKNI